MDESVSEQVGAGGPLRIGSVCYLNTAPLVEGLDRLEGVVFVSSPPARLAEMLRSGEVDVALASVVDAAPGDLALLPVGMIGSDGPTMTVRLCSRVALGEISTLGVDRESHTSVALARVILDRMYGARPEVVEIDVGVAGWPEAVVVIGDKVVRHAGALAEYPHSVDLGEAWKGLTGLPFVYAVWMCRGSEAERERIASIATILDRQRRRNLARLGWIVRERAAQHGWEEAPALRYLGEALRYEVGARERAAVSRFFAEARRLGLVGAVEPVWVEHGVLSAEC